MSEHRKWTQECNQPVELLARLRAMPSSLNDALRTMEDAASFIERCGVHTASAPDPDDIAEALQLVRRAREVYEAEPVDEAWSEMESAYATLIVKAFERRAALALSSAYRACQLCGEVAPLRCGPSRFGAETWACDSCWNPQEASTHSSTNSVCAKCGCKTNGEAALVGRDVWCHPCADVPQMPSHHQLQQTGE